MTPKSWVMSSSDRLKRCLQLAQQVEHLRLDGDVERRRRLVGDDQRRLAGERDRDHHALAHAAGELMRIVADAPRRRRGSGPRRAARSRARARLAPSARPWTVSASAIWSPTRITGFSAVIGSWKISAMRGAAHRAHLALGQRQQVAALEQDAAAGDAARRLQQPQDRQRGHRLAAARLADQAERLARRDLKADVVDGRDAATGAGRRSTVRCWTSSSGVGPSAASDVTS